MDETGHLRYLGRSSGFYYLQNSRTYQNGIFHFSGYKHKIASRMKSKDMTDLFALPPKDLSDHLLKIYFTHFYPFLPLFYKRHLVLSFTPFESVSPLLLNAIYALASRISPDIRVRSDPASPDTAGDVFFERAKRLLDGYYDTPKISTVQALLLMSSHQMGVMKAARAWLYSGMAFRMAQDLGLNRNCDHWNISPERRERRKRVFWCCFVVDRLTSASYGRSATFEERDCDVPFPSVDDDEKIYSLNAQSQREPASLLEIFTHLIKMCDIMGNVLKNIYYAKAKQHSTSQHIDHILTTLHRQLIQWQRNLPPSLEYQPPNTQNGEETPDPPSSICQLHMLYHTTVILLHRSFIPGPTQTHLSSSLPSYKICESAASSILDIAVNMLRENHLRNAYNFAVYFIFTAGIIFIKLASSDDPRRTFDAKILINRAMRALDELEMTWLNAARGCNILGELAGLRDINLECDEYVPRKVPRRSPPPSIAVPNSPEIEDDERGPLPPRVLYNPFKQQSSFNNSTHYSQFSTSNDLTSPSSSTPVSQSMPIDHHELHFSSNSSTSSSSNMPLSGFNTIKPTVDPFAAPEIIPVSSQQQFDPLGTAFWGVPSSFDMDEWNAYFDSLNSSATQQQQASTGGGEVSSLIMAPNEIATPSYIFDYQKRSSRDGSPLHLPGSPAHSLLFNLLDNPSSSNN
ncbi:hypothetical protein K501DRAFT_169852 [Backusella circina FSU 941]|nr:hypothetical protein K501DRAFT_169852 [Backusella circina FSU 941]